MTPTSGPDRLRPEIGLADAIRASARLGLDPVTALRVLSLSIPSAAAAPSPGTGWTEPAPVPFEDLDLRGDEPPGAQPWSPTEPPIPTSAALPPEDRRPPLIEPLPPDRPRLAGAPVPLPSVEAELRRPDAPRPLADAGLLPPARQRAILSALCRTLGPGDVDVAAAVRRLALAEPLRRLPTSTVPTMRRGVQILVDLGPGMQPFLRDQRELVRDLHRLTGPEGLEVLRFAGSPLDEPGAGDGPVWTWRPYRPPLDDRPVLVLSDLGTGPGHRDRTGVRQRWLRFAGMFQGGGRRLVALVPLPVQRLPGELRSILPVVGWDRTARVADAVRATRDRMGRGRRERA